MSSHQSIERSYYIGQCLRTVCYTAPRNPLQLSRLCSMITWYCSVCRVLTDYDGQLLLRLYKAFIKAF